MPTIQNGEVVQNSAARPLGIVSSDQDSVPVPIPNANTPNKAVCHNSRPRGRCAPMALATISITPPEIVYRIAISETGENDSSATRIPRYVVPQKTHTHANARYAWNCG